MSTVTQNINMIVAKERLRPVVGIGEWSSVGESGRRQLFCTWWTVKRFFFGCETTMIEHGKLTVKQWSGSGAWRYSKIMRKC